MKKNTRTKTTTTTEIEELRENPISKLIRNFFDTGDLSPELLDYNFEIRVQRWSEHSGRYLTLIGTKYTNLESLMDTIGRRYGSGKYKFFIKVKDAEGKQAGGAIIDDYEFIWDSEEIPEGTEVINDEDLPDPEPRLNPIIELMKAQMEQQNKLLLALLSNRQNGNSHLSGGETLEAIRTGIALADGSSQPGGSPPAENDLLSLLNSPLGKLLIDKITEKKIPEPTQ